jgi:tetratricopeptide (TPR) repeat protein
MNGTIPDRLDPWFEEGFAEYFRTITVDGKEADVGRVPDDEYSVLDNNGWLKIADLLRVQQNTKTYNESGDHRNVFYAESGMLVHYIYDNGLLPKLGDYYNMVANQHLPVEDAVQKAFGMSAPQFDKALLNYEKSGHYKYYKLAAPVGIDAKTYTSAPLKTTEAQAILADAHLHSRDYQAKAVEEFEAVLKADPDNAAALRGLGYSCLMKQDLEHAGEYFHKSARVNPNDPRVLYYSAMLYQREGAKPENMQAMQSELEQSIKLDPEFADAHSMLAWAYISQGQSDKAVASLRKAIELNPRNEQYRFNLANMYLQHQQFDEATAILRPLVGSSDPQVASSAAGQLTQVQQYRDQMRAMSQPSPRDVNGNALVNRGMSQPIEPEPIQLKVRPAKFLHGKLLSVDCSSLPAATLNIVAGSTKLSLHVSDSKKAMVIGADTLSCDWTNQNVAVNYREAGDGKGDLISLEIQ